MRGSNCKVLIEKNFGVLNVVTYGIAGGRFQEVITRGGFTVLAVFLTITDPRFYPFRQMLSLLCHILATF